MRSQDENLLEAMKEKDEVSQQLLEVNQLLKSKEDELNRLRETWNGEKVEMKSLIATLESGLENKSNIMKELERVRNEKEEMEIRLEELSRNFEAKIAEIVELNERHREGENSLKEVLRTGEEVKKQLQVQNMDLLGEVDSLKIEKEELEQSLNELKAIVDSTKSEMTVRNEVLSAELDRLQNENKALEGKIAQNQELFKKLSKIY